MIMVKKGTRVASVAALLVAAVTATAMVGTSASDGLVHHYPLDETSGALKDAVTLDVMWDGESIGATAGVAAAVGTGYELDGNGDYLSIVPWIRRDHEEYTFSIRGKGTGVLASFKTPPYENYLYYSPNIANGLRYHMGLYDNLGHIELDTSSLGDLSQGFHMYTLRGVRTGTSSFRVDVFVDGALVGSKERGGRIPAWSYAELGRTVVEHNGLYRGVLDDFRIWNRALTDSEIASTYAGSPPSVGLAHHFDLDDSATSLADRATSGGTILGESVGATAGVAAAVGTGYELDGSGDYLSIVPWIRRDHEEYTFSIRGKGTGVLASFKTPPYENYLYYSPNIANGLRYHMGLYDNLGHIELDTSSLGDLSQGFHMYTLRGVRTGTSSFRVDVFVDGALVGSKERGGRIPAWSYAELGRTVVEHNGLYRGVLDDFRIWNRALTNTEIAELDNQAPVADAGADFSVECTSPMGTWVELSGADSTDPDGDALTYSWSVPPGSGATLRDSASATPRGSFPVGSTHVTLVVTDARGATSTDQVVVTVVDTTPPTVRCSTDIAELWPPQRQMVAVGVQVTVADVASPVSALRVTCTVTSSEPDSSDASRRHTGDVGGYDGYAAPIDVPLAWDAAAAAYVGTVQLRAERSGSTSRRVYTVRCVGADPSGNSAAVQCEVVVPHDSRSR